MPQKDTLGTRNNRRPVRRKYVLCLEPYRYLLCKFADTSNKTLQSFIARFADYVRRYLQHRRRVMSRHLDNTWSHGHHAHRSDFATFPVD